MSNDAVMLLMVGGLHLLCIVCAVALLVPALRDPDARPHGEGESDGGWGQRTVTAPGPKRPRGGLPLPDAVPARVRLRDHRRLGELIPRRTRREVREPARTPARVHQ